MRLACLLVALPLIAACATAPESTAPPAPTADRSATESSKGGCPEPSSVAAGGRIAGSRFTVEKSSIKEGILELRQGEDFLADRAMTLFLFLDEGVVPANQSFDFEEDSGFGSPHVHMNWTAGEDSRFNSEVFMDDYRLALSFGEEADGVLPGTIHLCLPDKGKSWVSGTFEAAVEGFRLVDGKPDYRQDAMRNFEYLAADHLRAELGNDVTIDTVEHGRFTHPGPSGPQVGSTDVVYVAGGERHARRFLFVKLPDRWRVDKVLEMDRLAEAHPYREPGAAPFERDRIAWVVAQEIERQVHARHPGRAIYPGNDYSVVESYGSSDTRADVRASYKLGEDGENVVLQFVLERRDDGWLVARTDASGIRSAGIGGN